MTWNDKQLRAHKKAQAGLSVAGATLGIGALGAVGARAGAGRAVKVAQKAGRLKHVTPDEVKAFRGKATGISAGLTTGSAGVGGIGGFNFAGIQNAESKRSTKVAKRERFQPTKPQRKQLERNRQKGEAIGAAAGLAATAAFPGVRRAAVGSARLSRALYQGSKAGTSGGRLAIGGKKPSLKLRAVGVGQNAKRAAVAGGKGAATGGLYMMEKHPKQALGALGTYVAGSEAGSQTGYHRKRRELMAKSASDLDMGLGWVHQDSEISKAYNPERKRLRRLDAYSTGAATAAVGLGGAAGVHGYKTGKQVRTAAAAWKPKGSKSRTNVGDLIRRGDVPSYGGMPKAARRNVVRHLGKKSAITAGLGLASVGAAVGADRIKSYKRGNGRSYRPLHAQI